MKLLGASKRNLDIFVNWKHQKKIILQEWHNASNMTVLWGPWRPELKLDQKTISGICTVYPNLSLICILFKKYNCEFWKLNFYV